MTKIYDKNINVYFTERQKQNISAIAEREGVKRSILIRRWVLQKIKEYYGKNGD